MIEQSVIVIGGGIAGLTAGALLAHEGYKVTLLESHIQPGGCAGTFTRGPYVFDVGATQVAGFEKGGIHERIFRHLKCPLPVAEILDPACIVDLRDGNEPISLWHDPYKWKEECKKHFPGSDRFWSLCRQLHRSNWAFTGAEPILPVRNLWDFKQFISASRSINVLTGLFSLSSIEDLLWVCSCNQDQRLRNFLDCQLKLYSQKPSNQTSALYGATVLQMAQAPLGLWHLQGSMQKLSDSLLACLRRDGGNVYLGHKVVGLQKDYQRNCWNIDVIKSKNVSLQFQTSDVIFTLPPQSLLTLISNWSNLPTNYRHTLETLPKPSGAIVFFGAINRSNLPDNFSGHIQLVVDQIGSLFLSVSHDGDGRAPFGQATVIASAFTDVLSWNSFNEVQYRQSKHLALKKIVETLNIEFSIDSQSWLHKELATPRSFAKWTGRPQGIVGGLGQTPTTFGPFGLSSRTPLEGLWLCGDSIYPGEGTAGVSQSAVMACRQLAFDHGRLFTLIK
ncbi:MULTISPECIES: C-3',4' desaturase CrtD [unclassified Prochlorococcus]|uniref:C-3',4' desaturase CrtD n=1 Tax=unclassified Prochlorococcus TaxID=2627481 RepID=UPI000533A138|nr:MULTISPECIES: C-3',4' desaturase CrtD [unclassified Prochlorococcus]KGG14668.1 Neurosporene desaturase [Prochlorococcus sp. MIT 0602]KGG15902.1 Neurosporene desaturase [Prochlorococcus sp. MIT 0603]